ncbi:MAG TPA: DUF305 domain-containing protein [Chitinophagaceae bacterium]
MAYRKFFITLLISFFIMYLVMFLNIYEIGHYHTSLTRAYMTILMVTPMAVVMILMMGKMYQDRKRNLVIIVTSLLLFVAALAGLRSQTPVGDVQYMKAMIPHHSSAILTSKRANLSDPEVKKLAEQIIESQQKEIKEMEMMLERLRGR